MAEYEKSKSEKSRFKIGSAVERPVVDVPVESQSSGEYLDKFANSLDFKAGDENVANKVLDDLMSVEEKKAEVKVEGKEKKLADKDKENFRKAGQLLALDSISKAITGEGVSLSKEAAKKGRMKREYKLLGRLGLGTAKVPLWVATLPVRRPLSTAGLGVLAAAGLYGSKKYRRKKVGKR